MTVQAPARREFVQDLNRTGQELKTYPFNITEGDYHGSKENHGFSSPFMRNDLEVLSRALSSKDLLPSVSETFLKGHKNDPFSDESLSRFKQDRHGTPDPCLLAGLIAVTTGKDEKVLPGAFLQHELQTNPPVPLADNYIPARLMQLSQKEPINGHGNPFDDNDRKQIRAHAASLTSSAIAAYTRSVTLQDIDKPQGDSTNVLRLTLPRLRNILVNIQAIAQAA